MNAATANSTTRFNALLVEGDKGLGLESTLREQGCSVRRVQHPNDRAASESLDNVDAIIISASGFGDDEIVGLVGRAVAHANVLVATDSTALAVKVARLGATTVASSSIDLAAAQIGQFLSVIDLKRRYARQSASPSPRAASSSVAPRRSRRRRPRRPSRRSSKPPRASSQCPASSDVT